jgi:putative Mg2+ transporter-C (MgtC) family protein
VQGFEHSIEFLRLQIFGPIAERLILSVFLGGVIGLERQFRHKAAGLRTNMLICFGSAMFTVISVQMAEKFGGDQTRIAAQIIAGIGFLGAGAIIHSQQGSVVGLTSAATIFVTAAVGMAAGAGLYFTAIFATVVVLLALVGLGKLEDYFERKHIPKCPPA